MLRIFSILLCWGLKLMWTCGNGQWDLELTYPITELLAFFIALWIFATHESSEPPPLVAMFLDETFLPTYLELHVLGRESKFKIRVIWFCINWVLRTMKVFVKGILFSSKEIPGAIWELSFFIDEEQDFPKKPHLVTSSFYCFLRSHWCCSLTPCNSSVSWKQRKQSMFWWWWWLC